MYRANIKPWRSADWKPHLYDDARREKGKATPEVSEKSDEA